MVARATWTPDRVALLRRMAGRAPADEIAMALGVSERSVRTHALRLKLSVKTAIRAGVDEPFDPAWGHNSAGALAARGVATPLVRGIGRRAVTLVRGIGRRAVTLVRGIGRRAVTLAREGRRGAALDLLSRATGAMPAASLAPLRDGLEHLADLIAAYDGPILDVAEDRR